jgi:hypothetical protein
LKYSLIALASLIALIPLFPQSGYAQQTVTCELVNSRQLYQVGGGAVTYISAPTFNCTNGSTILADSAVYVKLAGRIDFIGHVRFNEVERTMTSSYAQYVTRERRLMAQQNVVVTNRKDGSTLKGVSLDYYQKSPTNPEARIEMYSRPHATLMRKGETDAAVDTTNIDADRLKILGENKFQGWENVVITRGKMTAKSGYAESDQSTNTMKLYGNASVVSDTFDLKADSIEADLLPGDKFKEVRARKDAKLTGRNVNVNAPAVRISFTEGKVERMVALGGARLPTKGAAQAQAISTEFTVIADSIDAKTPAEKLDRVLAVGKAYGERRPDSADAKLPALIAKDWVRGDTVEAHFAPTTPDTARVLERIVASGQPASSTYRLREKKGDSTEVSVNYITAKRIDVTMKAGEVDLVKAAGDIRGMYLQRPKAEEKPR